MSTQQQARALMMRHHQMVKNRQQSMLGRAAAEIGVDVEKDYWTTIQGNWTLDKKQLLAYILR